LPNRLPNLTDTSSTIHDQKIVYSFSWIENPTSESELLVNRHAIVAAAIIIQTLLGSFYAWSVFVPSLEAAGGLTATESQLVFGVMIGVFTVCMVAGGQWLERIGPRRLVLASGLLYGGGYYLASHTGAAFVPLLVCIGGLAGAGIGLGYVSCLSVCVRWFPERKGLITGLAVAGIGGGSVLVSFAGGALLERGHDALTIFGWMGLIYGVVIVALALVLRFPPTTTASAATPIPIAELGRSRIFWLASAGIFAGTFAGLLVIGNLKPIGLSAGVTTQAAVVAVAVFSVGNTLGRLVWGWAYDRWGFATLPVSLLLLGLSIALLVVTEPVPGLFVPVAVLVGLCFAACFVLYAALIAAGFGPERVGQIYPLVFLFYGLAAIAGPPAGGWLYEVTETHQAGIWLAAGMTWLGTISLAAAGIAPAHAASPRLG
jgi:OFA family oxalate/formate antiporter-like MFS transporter